MKTRNVLARSTGVALVAASLLTAGWMAGSATSFAAGHDTPTASAADASAFDDLVTNVRVRTALLTKLGWDALHISVDVHGPEVVLSGTVQNRSTGELAKEVALVVPRVEQVSDEVHVEPQSPAATPLGRSVDHADQEVRDALLEMHVKGSLLERIGTGAMHVEVEASSGVVSLRGTLPTEEQHELAVKTARQIKGVSKVVDLIREAS